MAGRNIHVNLPEKNHVRANSSLRNSLNSDWQKKLAENFLVLELLIAIYTL